ncbi:tripartite tricarboxylate transporter permease [Rhizobium lentis]|uniref:tripartite tricarboxylate transporter permease n=1 Tax=Rhizobium lentis TaxID=1138194 RepID=UPI001C82EF22|nr:tripartite tricarboxylate transporter permease [Rhizobium lentis]MBX5014985.1 tripartite tricarboxylate transporter permease [Rhizobium lentis]
MDVFHFLALGFSEALSPSNLLFCFVGAILGTIIGILPGMGPTATMAILLPLTTSLPPLASIVMLSAIYYGSQYSGSTTAILINLPGEPSSAATTIEGYQMARRGRAGAALAISALGSFFAGTTSALALAVAAPALSAVALSFGPPEYVWLCILGLLAAMVLARGSLLKATGMVCVGLLLAMVGANVDGSGARLTLGIPSLANGIDFVVVTVGLFGVAEIASNLGRKSKVDVAQNSVGPLWPTRQEFNDSLGAVVRGTLLGTLLGVLPGGGATFGAFSSYSVEKKISKTPEKFGQGAIAGVAGPESANNAASQSAFIPLLTLGIPSNSVMAMILAAMTMHGVSPEPSIIEAQPEIFWGLVASMWVGNVLLLVINLPLVGLWVRLFKMPYRLLYPAILLFCCIGVYSLNSRGSDVVMVMVFAAIGYVLKKARCETGPLLLGLVLGPLFERSLRQALQSSSGDPMVFVGRPISIVLLTITAGILLAIAIPAAFNSRKRSRHHSAGPRAGGVDPTP